MPDLIQGKTSYGKGVFAGRAFAAGERLLAFVGEVRDTREHGYPVYTDDTPHFQVGETLYMGPSGKLDDYVNHSCSPNAGLVFAEDGSITLVAIRAIREGEEVTWDYSTTNADGWEMTCLCGAADCRGKVVPFEKLPQKVQERYLAPRGGAGVHTAEASRGALEQFHFKLSHAPTLRRPRTAWAVLFGCTARNAALGSMDAPSSRRRGLKSDLRRCDILK